MEKKLFGKLTDGTEVYAYTIADGDVSITLLDFGATLQKFVHKGTDIICGFDTLEPYELGDSFHGATVGRYANRIRDAHFFIDGKEYKLAPNNHGNHLHGGIVGFNKKMWKVEGGVCKTCGKEKLVCTMRSPDGEEGYPGNLDVKVTFKIVDNALSITYKAATDKPTYINLTNHSFFNLHGQGNPSIFDHVLKINADSYTEVGAGLIPTGNHPDVTGTPFDFRVPKTIGRDTSEKVDGYDHNFVLNGSEKVMFGNHEYKVAAVCSVPEREMTVLTDQPGMQVYTGNFMHNSEYAIKGGIKQLKHMAVCFETQCEPDSPTKGDARLNPGEIYVHRTVYKLK